MQAITFNSRNTLTESEAIQAFYTGFKKCHANKSNKCIVKIDFQNKFVIFSMERVEVGIYVLTDRPADCFLSSAEGLPMAYAKMDQYDL